MSFFIRLGTDPIILLTSIFLFQISQSKLLQLKENVFITNYFDLCVNSAKKCFLSSDDCTKYQRFHGAKKGDKVEPGTELLFTTNNSTRQSSCASSYLSYRTSYINSCMTKCLQNNEGTPCSTTDRNQVYQTIDSCCRGCGGYEHLKITPLSQVNYY